MKFFYRKLNTKERDCQSFETAPDKLINEKAPRN